MKNASKKRHCCDVSAKKCGKTVFCTTVLLLWAILVCFCILGLISAFSEETKPVEEKAESTVIHFANVDYKEDIYKNERWLACDRQIYFGDQYTYRSITSEDAEKLGQYAEFFYRYFQTIISGDAEGYRASFSENSPNLQTVPQEFTMQKLYEMYALEYADGVAIDEDGNEVKVKDFIVRYKILENNGTFRHDLASGVGSEQYYRLTLDSQGMAEIYQILELRPVQPQPESGDQTASAVDVPRVILFGILLVLLAAVAICFAVRFLKKYKNKKACL